MTVGAWNWLRLRLVAPTTPTFIIDQARVHDAAERAAQDAVRTEVQRQFSRQFPCHTLSLENYELNLTGFRFEVAVPGYDVVDA